MTSPRGVQERGLHGGQPIVVLANPSRYGYALPAYRSLTFRGRNRRACGQAFYTPEQVRSLEARAVRQLRATNGLLLPAEIGAIRKRYGLTQAEFEKLLGVGANTVVRWERGQVTPNAATMALLRLLAADPRNAQRLAEWHGVMLRGAA